MLRLGVPVWCELGVGRSVRDLASNGQTMTDQQQLHSDETKQR